MQWGQIYYACVVNLWWQLCYDWQYLSMLILLFVNLKWSYLVVHEGHTYLNYYINVAFGWRNQICLIMDWAEDSGMWIGFEYDQLWRCCCWAELFCHQSSWRHWMSETDWLARSDLLSLISCCVFFFTQICFLPLDRKEKLMWI